MLVKITDYFLVFRSIRFLCHRNIIDITHAALQHEIYCRIIMHLAIKMFFVLRLSQRKFLNVFQFELLRHILWIGLKKRYKVPKQL